MYEYATCKGGLMNLKNRDFLKLLDYSEDEIRYLLDLAHAFKKMKHEGVEHKYLKGKNIALLFEKTSTRTRCAFEVAASDLGMHSTYLDPKSSQMGKKESIEDTARVLARMYDGIEYRGFSQSIVEEIARAADVPVWNGLTDEFHPTQMLADMLTIEEVFGKLKGLQLTFVGDLRNNAGNSLMVVCSKMGLNFVGCGPKELWPKEELIETCKSIALKNSSTITFTEDLMEACKNSDIIYTDVWVSMGEPDDVWEKRIKLLKKYQVKESCFQKENTIFMHALPSFHDLNTEIGKSIYEKFNIPEMEVEDKVFESERSKVFDEAENRLHTIKAVMYATLKED